MQYAGLVLLRDDLRSYLRSLVRGPCGGGGLRVDKALGQEEPRRHQRHIQSREEVQRKDQLFHHGQILLLNKKPDTRSSSDSLVTRPTLLSGSRGFAPHPYGWFALSCDPYNFLIKLYMST